MGYSREEKLYIAACSTFFFSIKFCSQVLLLLFDGSSLQTKGVFFASLFLCKGHSDP